MRERAIPSNTMLTTESKVTFGLVRWINPKISDGTTITRNLLDVYKRQGGAGYDVAEERDVAGMLVVSIVPLLLLILVFSSVMSIAAESVAGEKERGTMATLLATPIKRHDIAPVSYTHLS